MQNWYKYLQTKKRKRESGRRIVKAEPHKKWEVEKCREKKQMISTKKLQKRKMTKLKHVQDYTSGESWFLNKTEVKEMYRAEKSAKYKTTEWKYKKQIHKEYWKRETKQWKK